VIPRTVAEWSIEVIERLLTLGYRESESFDWNVALPHSKDDTSKEGVTKSCAAFANSAGGFLVFGVSDDASAKPRDRMVGIEANAEFFEHFGVYPQRCRPTVPWTPRNPPLRLAGDREIHIIHFAKSWNGPHCYEGRAGGLVFPKRTNKGNENMSYDEVRGAFLGYYEKRLKLQLLRSELENIRVALEAMVIRRDNFDSAYPLTTFDLAVIESVLSDTYTILTTDPVVLSQLTSIRRVCRLINNRLAMFFSSYAVLSGPERQQEIRQLNEFIGPHIPGLDTAVTNAIQALDGIISK
jgi:hypothetical protein